MTRRRWLAAVVLWQITGLLIGLSGAFIQNSLHEFIAFLILCLTFTNAIAILGTIFWLFYERFLGKRIKQKQIAGAIILVFLGASVYFGTEGALTLVNAVCDINQPHEMDMGHAYLLVADLIIALVIAGAYFVAFMYEQQKANIKRKMREVENLKRMQTESKLEILQAKINPHFLFNTLNTMLDLIYQKPHLVESIILNLSGIYRKLLTLPDNEFITLEEELKLVREYLEIEKIRMDDRLEFQISADDRLANLEIPPLVITILVENAVQHGIDAKRRGGQVFVLVYKEGARVIVNVRDTGGGTSRKREQSGFGIYNVHQRLNLLYHDEAKLTISRLAEGGTKATINLPYIVPNQEMNYESHPLPGKKT